MPEPVAPAATPAAPPPRTAQHVVTSENRAEYMARRLEIAQPAPPAAAAEPPKPEAKAEAATAAKDAEPPKDAAALAADLEQVIAEQQHPQATPEKKQRLQARFSELTQKIKDAEARAEKSEEEAAALRAKVAAPLPPPPPAAAEEPAEPKREAFATEEAYQDAMIDYRVDKRIAVRDKAQAEARAREEGQRVVSTYAERLKATKAEVKDYDQRIEPVKDLAIPPHIRDAIFESEVGPRLPLYFADHPEDARRIIALAPGAALREIGKIEAMIETKAAPAPAASPAPKISAAPPPITPIRAGAGSETEPKLDSAGNFTGTYAEWKALRKAGKLR